ncbi:MAG: DUF2256 domain-containing protein [Pirellulaceae bacterium]
MAHKKPDLPTKTCVHCARLFAWRKKWVNVWEQVRFCSDRCRSEARKKKVPTGKMNKAGQQK